MNSPKLVPVLKADDFVIGPYRMGDRYCLVGWRHRVFGYQVNPCTAMHEAISTLDHIQMEGGRSIMEDRPNTPANRNLAVRIWNLMLKKLDFTDDGPTTDLDKLVKP